MFTGIVEELGRINALSMVADGVDAAARVTIAASVVVDGLRDGDSVAVSGVCLTAVDVTESGFSADVMRETLQRSTLSAAAAGAAVNLERAATLHTRLGGHLVQGHVDATGEVVDRQRTPRWDVVRIGVPDGLTRYIVTKGSIAVDGVSLTVVDVDATSFTVSLIPTTLERTTLGSKPNGAAVNLEVDVMAKYAERLLALRGEEFTS